jgi:DNA-binding transcriptional LysR family regulator
LRRAANDIQQLSDPTAGEVRIGCTPILAASFASTVVAELATQYPRMVFHLVSEYLEPLRRRLRDRSLDLLIVRRFVPDVEERIDFETLSEDRYIVAVGRRSPYARRSKLELADLVDVPWTLPSNDSIIGPLARQAFQERGLHAPSPTVIANSPETRISLLASGHFVTVFPASILRFASIRSEIKVLPIELPSGRAENVLVTWKGRTLSRVAQIFIERARHEAKSG